MGWQGIGKASRTSLDREAARTDAKAAHQRSKARRRTTDIVRRALAGCCSLVAARIIVWWLLLTVAVWG